MSSKNPGRKKKRTAYNKKRVVNPIPETRKISLKCSDKGSYYNQEEWLDEYYGTHQRHLSIDHLFSDSSSDSDQGDDDSDSDYELSDDSSDSDSDIDDSNFEIENTESPYAIICPVALKTMLDQVAVCRFCRSKLQIIDHENSISLGRCWSLRCENENCKSWTVPARNMTPKVGRAFEINRNLVLACRSIGKGRSAASTLLSTLNLHPPVSSSCWREHGKRIECVATECLQTNLKEEAMNVKRFMMESNQIPRMDDALLEQENVKITASVDGSWKSRGWASKTGIVDIGFDGTGKIIDVILKHSHCRTCNLLKEQKI